MCGIDSAIISAYCRSKRSPSNRTTPTSGPAGTRSQEVVTNEASLRHWIATRAVGPVSVGTRKPGCSLDDIGANGQPSCRRSPPKVFEEKALSRHGIQQPLHFTGGCAL